MTDITANVVVSMPSQLFTMARSFKAVANGKIYIGKIDTDPVNPENQIPVYVENEDGSHVPVSQPIIINAAGYPVYNGQIAKFVTVQGHSMAVYDAYGAQQFYFPNVLKYDPDQYQKSLEKVKYWVTLKEFGAIGDGVTNDAPAIAKALNYAYSNNLDVRQSDGTFLLDGDTYLDIKSLNVDLTGCVLKPSATWKGQITISQPEIPVTYGVGSAPVNGVNASTGNSRGIGSNYLDGLASNTDLDGCFIQLSTSQPMFTFRDTAYTRVDFNRVYNRGNLENPLKYALGNNATSIKALKIRKDVQTIKGLTIDESLTRNYRIIYINQASRVRLINTSFINRPLTQNFSDSRLEIYESYDVIVDGLFAPSVADSFTGTGDIYSYTIGLGNSMNVTIKNATANGEGWGATGSNNCANVRFERCDLSRIDFHMPFQNYLKINDCNIGRSGVLVTGIGDLYVTNSTFNSSPDMPGNIIATRADAGGYFDGDLYMENIKLTGLRNGIPGNGIINAVAVAGQGPSSGSPISPTLFNSITMKDIKIYPGSVSAYPGTLITVNRDNTLYFPKKIVIDGLDFGTLPKSAGVGLNIDFSRFKALYSDMNNSESAVTGRYTTDILINDVCAPFFSVTSASFRHNPRVVASNVRHGVPGETYTVFETNQRGSYELTDCKFERIRAYYGSDPNGPVSIKMKGGKLWSASPTLSPIDGATVHDITLDNVQIVGAFLSQDQTTFPVTRGLIGRALVRNCEFWDVTGVKQPSLPFVTVESTSVTMTVPFKVDQQFVISTGFTSGNTYTLTNAKAIGSSGAKQNFNIGTAGNIILTYTVSGANVTRIVMTSPVGNEIRTLSII
ncbi:phage head-binding domain-containing protein [Escherichia coli]|uniref:phage head-binding domain-containing protein n=1 Tax=Escherichia coli TaxID=562 RepID=UPI00201B3350|nr:phage head-binding domain-containing protein [Escherichia coli]